jgi:hypothetical protein
MRRPLAIPGVSFTVYVGDGGPQFGGPLIDKDTRIVETRQSPTDEWVIQSSDPDQQDQFTYGFL